MSRFLKSLIGGVVLASSVFVSGTGSSVHAVGFDARTPFPVCATGDQEFCIETFEFTPTGGALRSVTPSVDAFGVTASDGFPDVNVVAMFPMGYSSTGLPDASYMLPPLSLNYYDRGSNIVGNAITAVGLRDGNYRVVVRTGDYDPSLMTLTGQFSAYSVVKGADGNFTIDLSATPKPLARVVQIDGDNSAENNCVANNWVGSCAANLAGRFYINASFSMVYMTEYRAAMRGAWIATNASTTQISTAEMLQGQLNVIAKGPHTVPADFGTTSAGIENGKYLNPAYFEEYLPFPLMSLMMSSMSGTEITAAMAKDYLTESTTAATSVMTGSISVSTSGETPVDTPRDLILTPDASGVRVNFNLTHFSAPNPKLKLKIPAALAALVKPTVTRTKSATALSFALYKKLAVTKTSTVSLKVTTASKKYCTVISTKVKGVTTMKLKGLRKGTCKVTVIVTPKKGAAKRATVSLNIT